MSKPKAVWEECAGIRNDGVEGHAMRDFCSSCAPYWSEYPTCPTHKGKLSQKGWCKACRKFYDVRRALGDFLAR